MRAHSCGGIADGIIFDMDNTLLRSRIDFAAMKEELYRYCVQSGLLASGLPIERHTCATLITQAEKAAGMNEHARQQMWDIVERHETEGMQGARLEPGVEKMLDRLAGDWLMTVLTNNARKAAVSALEDNRIADRFHLIAGREQMSALKPSPSGIEYIQARFPEVDRRRWLMVGDSWIDGKAAAAAGIPFVLYGDDAEPMSNRGVPVHASIRSMTELETVLSRQA